MGPTSVLQSYNLWASFKIISKTKNCSPESNKMLRRWSSYTFSSRFYFASFICCFVFFLVVAFFCRYFRAGKYKTKTTKRMYSFRLGMIPLKYSLFDWKDRNKVDEVTLERGATNAMSNGESLSGKSLSKQFEPKIVRPLLSKSSKIIRNMSQGKETRN